MPIHDWTRVTAGTFHDFHLAWIAELRRALNGGLLPAGYYAQAEQVANNIIPDVLTLQDSSEPSGGFRSQADGTDDEGGVAVAKAPPRVAMSETLSDSLVLAARRRRLVIRHTSGDRIVALIEIMSPGNKEGRNAFESFVGKAAEALEQGYHLLVIDLFPPGRFDPSGIHAAIWEDLGGRYEPPPGKQLTLAAYVAKHRGATNVTCYVQPCAVGERLVPMPLFLNPEHYVNVPLEETYFAAYEGVPRRWKQVIET